jgi:O-antigen/teichoic acid export membrane protein
LEREFTRSTKILIIGEILAVGLSFGSSFFLIRFFSPEDYSIYNLILVVPMILLYIGDFGLFHGGSYYVARLGKLNKKREVRNVIKITLIAKLLLGIGFAITIFFFAEVISSSLFTIQNSTIVPLLQLASILLITDNVLEAIYSILIGSTNMKSFTIVNVIRYGAKFLLTLLLVFLGWNIFGAIIGTVLATSIAGIFGFLYIRKKMLKHSGKKESMDRGEKESMEWKCLPLLMKRGFSFSLVAIIHNVKFEVFMLFLAIFGFFIEVSYLKVGVTLITIFYVILRPVVLSLFPIFSKYSWSIPSEKKILKKVFRYSNKFCTLFISPVIIFCIVFASEIIPLVFPLYLAGTQFISVFFIYFLPLTIGMLALPSFFFSQGYSGLSFLIEFVSFSISIILGVFLSFVFGSLGFAIGISLGAFLGFIFGIIITYRKFGKELFSNSGEWILIIIIAVLLCGVFFFGYSFLNLENIFIKILILGSIFICFYILFLIILVWVDLLRDDEMSYFIREFQNIPIVNKILHFIVVFGKIFRKKKNE